LSGSDLWGVGRMQRREFLVLVGGAAAILPAHAQQARAPRRLAFVHSGIPADKLTEMAGPYWVRQFYAELKRLGHVEGGNLVVERFSAEGRTDAYEALASAVVGSKPDIIVSNQNLLTKAIMAATSTIPIVAISGNPIAGGLATSLAHPGGNLTGVSIDAGVGIAAKRLQLLKEASPAASKIVYLVAGSTEAERSGLATIARLLPVVNEAELARAFAEMAEQKVEGVIVGESGNFLGNRAVIVEFAARHRLPTIYPYRDYADLGGLISYAPELGELATRLASDVHQILGGAKPGDIPYYQPTKFELVVNLKTAKALGLAISQILIAQADEVIE
jgi:putative tryptophan/tyrosine transport system substrate-binding protein